LSEKTVKKRWAQEAFSRLKEIAPSLDLDVVEVEGEDKYVDREYALRKIGLRRV